MWKVGVNMTEGRETAVKLTVEGWNVELSKYLPKGWSVG